jgi:hypothetical protein
MLSFDASPTSSTHFCQHNTLHYNLDLIATMSLASIAFSRLSTKVITPLSSTIIPKLGSFSSGGVGSGSSSAISLFQPQQLLHHQPQQPSSQIISIRSVFSEVIRQIPSDDPQKQGTLTFEDPDLADARIGRNIRGECK